MEATEVAGMTVLNDAYNANPESMRAALKSLAILAAGGRGIAVLGQMAELGSAAPAAHQEVGRLAAELQVDLLVAVGEPARPIVDGAMRHGSWTGAAHCVPDRDAAVRLLLPELRPGDVVLVKGSRAAGLERVAQALIGALGSEPGQA
jgi:UDP-N-acetylmuramoyl-tripeptide--D-alanyl-D-alanine ligase